MNMIVKIILVLLLVSVIGIVIQRQRDWGTTPIATFDAAAGQFAPCPDTPTCVSTQAPVSDQGHNLAPIPFSGTAEAAKSRLLRVLQTMPRTTILTDTESYVHVEMRTLVLGVADDAEFFIDSASQTIQLRASTRGGFYDWGNNRRRMETIRRQFEQF